MFLNINTLKERGKKPVTDACSKPCHCRCVCSHTKKPNASNIVCECYVFFSKQTMR